jgi:hypothetical protein
VVLDAWSRGGRPEIECSGKSSVAAMREWKEIRFSFGPRLREDKAQGGVHERRLHVLRVVGSDQATAVLPRVCGHALARTCGHGPSWAAGKRACHFSYFFQDFLSSEV